MNGADSQRSGRIRQLLDEARATLKNDPEAAAGQVREIIAGNAHAAPAYRVLAAALRRLGRDEEAARAEADAIRISARSPRLVDAADAMRGQRVERAESLIRAHLAADPDDPQGLRMLAEIAAVCGHVGDAERLLRKALDSAPGFVPLYINLAALLQDLRRTDEALALLDVVLTSAPDNTLVLSFKAEILTGADRMDEALETHQALLALVPDAAVAWMNYGHALRIVGRSREAVAACRESLRLDPASGFAWWALANLGTVKLDQEDLAAMQAALAGAGDDLDRLQLHFALGNALGSQERFEESFSHYAAANELRRVLIPYDPNRVTETVRQARALFTAQFLRARTGQGCAAPDPIFIVGLPRSGTTLIEQILASHPFVEGAGELPDMERLATAVAARAGAASWLDAVGGLRADALHELGAAYLGTTRACRRTERPFFTDKMPFNWAYVGLIHLILPNARIVDVRRHPLGCCFSNFSRYFSRTVSFASSLEDLGRYYVAYVRMMAHFDRALPGRVHRVSYEDLVANPEREVRRLLNSLGLPFDPACLRFYENPRAVHTPSAEQVRRPVNRDGLERWRRYEPWLGPLKATLGAVLDLYPARLDERAG